MADLLKSRLRMFRGHNNESGYTLIELLVASASALIVGAAALTFLVISIDQQNQISSRSTAVSQAEAGLQQLTRDLRNAMYESSTNASTYNAVKVGTNAAAGTTTLIFQIPTPGNDGVGERVVWTCPSTLAATVSNCTRTVTPSGGASSTQTPIMGVLSANFTLTEGNSSSTQVPVTGSGSTTSTYPSGTVPPIATVGITLRIADVSQLDLARQQVVSGVSNPITLQTTADLRNFG